MSFVWNNLNPATGSVINTFTTHSTQEVFVKLNELYEFQKTWQNYPVSQRLDSIINLSYYLESHKNELAFMMATEMGKPISQGVSEVEKCVQTCKYFVEHGLHFMASEEVEAQYKSSWIVKRPLGVVLAIMPWNFPLWQVIRCAIPALMVGNTILLKHAPLVQGFATHLEKIFNDVFREPVLKQIAIQNSEVEEIIAHPYVAALSFTGSAKAGRQLAALAGTHLKKCVLELGGSDPYFIFNDADLELAAQLCVKSRFINSGQSCVAAKKFYIHEDVYNDFRKLVINKVQKLKVGSPLDKLTEVGPLAEERFRQQLISQINNAIIGGAEVLCGGDSLDVGFYLTPTVIENVTPTMELLTEEVFGPVMPLVKVNNMNQAIQQANQSRYGLGAAIFTKQNDLAWKLAVESIEAGMIAINQMVSSDPRLPFGGVKNSGFGRELGLYGLNEFVNIKTIGIN